jgi:hypothetical protein
MCHGSVGNQVCVSNGFPFFLSQARYFAGMVSYQVWDNKALKSLSVSQESNREHRSDAQYFQKFRHAGKTNEYSEKLRF